LATLLLLGSTGRVDREMQVLSRDKQCRSPDRDKDFQEAAVDPAGADSAAAVLAAEVAAVEGSSVEGNAVAREAGLRESKG
jgi:hypothetical protein